MGHTGRSQIERAGHSLGVGVVTFRWIALSWMVLGNALSDRPMSNPALGWTGMAVASVFTVVWTVSPRRNAPSMRWADLAIATALVLCSAFVVEPGAVVGQRLFFAATYPIGTALAWGATGGIAGGLGAALVLGGALAASRPLNDVPLHELTGGQVLAVTNGVVGYLLAGLAGGVTATFLDEALAQTARTAGFAERNRLLRLIHDSAQQTLKLGRRKVRQGLETGGLETADLVELDALMAEMDRLLHEPPLPEETADGWTSLRDALARVPAELDRVGWHVDVHLDVPDIAVPRSHAAVLAEATCEALRNVAQHAGTSAASVAAARAGRWVTVSVRDEGAGFDADAVPVDARGLEKSMRARLEEVSGTMHVQTAPGYGTTVELRVPSSRTAGRYRRA